MMSEPLFILLSFLTFVSGSPVSSSGHHMDTEPMYGFGAGASGVGLIVLFLHMLVWVEVISSTRPVPNKVLWCALVFVFPIVGLIAYALFANRAAHKPHDGYEPIAPTV